MAVPYTDTGFMQDAVYELRRTPLPRTRVNKPWPLLLASPLYAVHHLLRLGHELLEGLGGCLYEYGHRLTLYVLQYYEANLLSVFYVRPLPVAVVEEGKVYAPLAQRRLHGGVTMASNCTPFSPPTLVGFGFSVFRCGLASNQATMSSGAGAIFTLSGPIGS